MTATTEQDTVQSRLPDPAQFYPDLTATAAAINKTVRNGVIPASTITLVQLRAGQIVGSTYHVMFQTKLMRTAGESEERIATVVSWRDSPYFTEPERAALELVEAVLVGNPLGERVPDEVYAKASAHYDDKELWALTMAISQICFFIPIGLIARPIPGKPLGQNYSS
ncbi:alkylhydroperoxidase [Actinosynnema sp. ALI-1.44]|uniref:carboxymuconolactone decarboxylase family protein n=1 Tax=Actinosynnema sp. ALI-1.44 TaxID=1933779 RepID=UPI00097CAC2D|nr:carboxymuconolactone decarboxylase family protein [Actinosynnema sp. ALI-1.44]ONI87510.1 alkylhydroperoxidase [Actinosynnema sp. ALI-1.44]